MSMPRSVPTMENRPSANAISATAASSTSAAACLPFVDHRIGGQQDRLALGIQAARAAGAAADRNGVGVALADADLLAVDAKALRRELDIGGLVTLAGRLRADIDIDEAIVGEADLRPLGRIAAGGLQIVGESDAATLAACRGRGAPRGEARRSPSASSAASSTIAEIAAVVGLADRRGVRHRRRAAPCCAGAVRRGRSSVRARRHRPGAPPGSCSRDDRRRDRHPPARCW